MNMSVFVKMKIGLKKNHYVHKRTMLFTEYATHQE